jgi:hypothetical protein
MKTERKITKMEGLLFMSTTQKLAQPAAAKKTTWQKSSGEGH